MIMGSRRRTSLPACLRSITCVSVPMAIDNYIYATDLLDRRRGSHGNNRAQLSSDLPGSSHMTSPLSSPRSPGGMFYKSGVSPFMTSDGQQPMISNVGVPVLGRMMDAQARYALLKSMEHNGR